METLKKIFNALPENAFTNFFKEYGDSLADLFDLILNTIKRLVSIKEESTSEA